MFIRGLEPLLWPTATDHLAALSAQYKRFIGLMTHLQAGRPVVIEMQIPAILEWRSKPG